MRKRAASSSGVFESIFPDGREATRFGQCGEDKFHRFAAIEKRSPDSHGSSRKVVRLAAVFGDFLADEDSQRTHEINQVRLACIPRVDFQQVQQFGENIRTDATQLAILEAKELRLLR